MALGWPDWLRAASHYDWRDTRRLRRWSSPRGRANRDVMALSGLRQKKSLGSKRLLGYLTIK
jgi:hypothetical protein